MDGICAENTSCHPAPLCYALSPRTSHTYAATQTQLKLENYFNLFGLSFLYPRVVRDNSTWSDKTSWIINNAFRRSRLIKNHPQPFHTHSTAEKIMNNLGKKIFDSSFSFGVVRNPWDWQVSLYEFAMENTTHPQNSFTKGLGSFENYINWRCAEEVSYQKDFLYSPSGQLLVNFVGRFENLEADFKYICDQIGIEAKLPLLNTSFNREDYKTYYSKKTIELVRRTFAPDIDLFGYDFY